MFLGKKWKYWWINDKENSNIIFVYTILEY